MIEDTDYTDRYKVGSLRITKDNKYNANCSFVLYVYAVGQIVADVGKQVDIWIDGYKKFYGVIRSLTWELLYKDDNTKLIELTIEATDMKVVCNRRTVSVSLNETTAGGYVTSLVNNYLMTEGITAGTIQTGAQINEADYICKPIGEIIEDLAQKSGYVWGIDENGQLHFLKEPPITSLNPVVLTENGDIKIYDVKLTRKVEDYANKVFVKYADDSVAVVQDDYEIQTRQAIEGGSGVYGYVIERDDIETQTDAETLANTILQQKKILPEELQLTVHDARFDVNKSIYVNLSTFNLQGTFLITECNIADNMGIFEHELTLQRISYYKKKKTDIDVFNDIAKMAKEGATQATGKPISVESNRALTDFGAIERLDQDVNGIFTKVIYYRHDGTKFMESVLSGGTSPQYTTRTETYYAADGTTVVETRTYQQYYNSNGEWIKEVPIA
ncbi:hypothetical protein [Caldicellulosiruptor owensensis]|nr:hypothetical protein [Caldicellulosiruptor owensensis]